MGISPDGSPGPSQSRSTFVRFGAFEVDLESGELRKQGRRVRLSDQPFHILRIFLRRTGHVVTREELQRELWSDDTFVDFEVGLNSAIRKLRDALGDSAENPIFIETLPRKGYRFIAALNGIDPQSTSTDAQALHNPHDPLTRVREPGDSDGLAAAASLADDLPPSLGPLGTLGAPGRWAQRGPIRVRGASAAATMLVLASLATIGAVQWNRSGARRAPAILSSASVTQPRSLPASNAGRVTPKAYEAYVDGLRAEGEDTVEGFQRAVGYFEQAIALQPDFADAYAGLATAQLQFLWAGPLSPRETIPKAEWAAHKAVELDPNLAEAHRVLGEIQVYFYWNPQEADRELERARGLRAVNEGRATMPVASLIRRGLFDDAITEAERLRRLDPQGINTNLNVARAYRAAGQNDRAIEEINRLVQMGRGRPRVHFELGATLARMGRFDDAIGEFEAAVRTHPQGNPRFKAYLGYACAAAGRPADARKILDDLESLSKQQYISAFGFALIYDALGEKELVLAALKHAYDDRALEFSQMSQVYPPFKSVASDPRFQELMRRIGPGS
jgi:DNA-binding winged helix-turn-helix (wHTH) protein/Flp pilus assembly protein TadD